MNKKLSDVIADILTNHGAVVEKTDNGCLDVITPSEVSKILNIPEYVRLSFSYGETRDEAISASYDSEFFSSIKNLFTDKGRFTNAYFESHIPSVEKISKILPEKIAFRNATFRLDRTETKDISYLLTYFKYIALSDEKYEGIMSLLINETNLSTMPFENSIEGLMGRLNEPDSDQQSPPPPFNQQSPPPPFNKGGQGGIRVLQTAYVAANRMVQKRMKDFIKSLERRLNRDIKRVYEYYETLKSETKKAIERKVISSEEPIDINFLMEKFQDKMGIDTDRFDRQTIEKMVDYFEKESAQIHKQIEERSIKGEGIDKLLNKLNAIEAERKWKIQDLIAKYALSIRIEPVAALSIETQAPVFWINIKRRLASRQFPFTYNPIVRQFDALPCESCFDPHEGYYICDDRLHIVCGNCFRTCPHCGRQYCKACHKDICPKCKKEWR